MSRQAMILAAGIGTRLGEMTRNKPKALVEYSGKPLLQHVIESIIQSGFDEIIINVHHFADMIIEFLKIKNNFNVSMIISDERDQLLDTGGAILKASGFFSSKNILIHNVDIISSMDLNNLMNFHDSHGKIATLAVKDRETTRSLLHSNDNLLCGWRDNRSGQEIITRPGGYLQPVAFSGVYVIQKDFPDFFNKTGVFPLMPELLSISENHDIILFPHHNDTWKDMGKPEAYR